MSATYSQRVLGKKSKLIFMKRQRERERESRGRKRLTVNPELLYYSCFSVGLKFFKTQRLKAGYKKSLAGLEKAATRSEAAPEQENWAHHPCGELPTTESHVPAPLRGSGSGWSAPHVPKRGAGWAVPKFSWKTLPWFCCITELLVLVFPSRNLKGAAC